MKIIDIRVTPEQANEPSVHKTAAAKILQTTTSQIREVRILRKSLDARKKPVFILRCEVWLINDPAPPPQEVPKEPVLSVHNKTPVIIAGAGPAGLFAALTLIRHKLKPVIIERGKPVRERRFDLAALMKRGELNTESNYCFGEGGAGTFSDGKLYTRSGKRGNVNQILQTLVNFGAPESILVDAHPHIGTNKLPGIIQSIRTHLLDCGAEFHFSHRFSSLITQNSKVKGMETSKGTFDAPAILLATGHSARDVYRYLDSIGLMLEPKGFAVGVRIEHPQELVNRMQYGRDWNSAFLPPASYQLVTQANERGVYSFCMCPGGIICPASTDHERLVVNGWSPSGRNSRFANSGMVVEILPESFKNPASVLEGLDYQDGIEAAAFREGGGRYKAPAQRLADFIKPRSTISSSLPECSYVPGVTSAQLEEVLPPELHSRLKEGLRNFIRKNSLYGSSEAILVGVESRTSSPVRIPRQESGMHPQLAGLFPCGEGAGYAGGIVSAALDGVRAAEKVAAYLASSREE
jgi:uncharacterized FAD-dependent dehydrogenase